MRGVTAVSCFAALVAAAPKPQASYPASYPASIAPTLYSTAAAPTAVALVPCPHPDFDRDDFSNLKATKDTTLRYAESLDDIDQEVATIHSEDIDNPLVQLEHSSYIGDLSCTENSATIVFTDREAFQTAADDWQTHDQFIIVSYDPKCGHNFDASKRDYMLAKSIAADDGTMTINAEIEFVEFDDAFGNSALISCDIGRYHAQHQPKKRQFWDDLIDNINPGNWGITEDGSTQLSWNEYPTNEMTNSFNWGPGYEIYGDDTYKIACVGCGTDGEVTLTGTIDFTLGDGVRRAEVSLEGRMRATLALGVEATIAVPIPIANITLANIPLTPFTIAGVITLGPQIGIEANTNIILSAAGGAVVGATLDWPAMRASADYATSSASADGLVPNVTPKTQFDGSIGAALDLSVPVSLGVGLTISAPLAGEVFDATLALVDRPGIQVGAEISNMDECEGVTVNSEIYNNVGIDVFGLLTVPLADWSAELFSTCIATGGSEEPTTTEPPVSETTTEVPVTTTDVPVTTTDLPVTTTDVPSDTTTTPTDIPSDTTTTPTDTPITTTTPITTPIGTGPIGTGPIGTGTGGIPAYPTIINSSTAPYGNGTTTSVAPPVYATGYPIEYPTGYPTYPIGTLTTISSPSAPSVPSYETGIASILPVIVEPEPVQSYAVVNY